MAIAYFLTWTCHGSWLPGDQRGWVDSRHNRYGSPMLRPNAPRETYARSIMRTEPRTLTAQERAVVKAAIEDHCTLKMWKILAINIRTNHIHIVVSGKAMDLRPEVVMGQLKSWSTRRLREAGMRNAPDRIWAREGSTRYLYTQQTVDNAVTYVVTGQGTALDPAHPQKVDKNMEPIAQAIDTASPPKMEPIAQAIDAQSPPPTPSTQPPL